MSASILTQEGGVEVTLGYSVPISSTIKPRVLYFTVGKQIMLTHNDEDNYSLTPSLGYAEINKSIPDVQSSRGDLIRVSYVRLRSGLELGKDSYWGRLSLVANHNNGMHYGIKIRVFLNR